jgi:hypothetical protein
MSKKNGASRGNRVAGLRRKPLRTIGVTLRIPGPEINMSGRLLSDPALHDPRTLRETDSAVGAGEAESHDAQSRYAFCRGETPSIHECRGIDPPQSPAFAGEFALAAWRCGISICMIAQPPRFPKPSTHDKEPNTRLMTTINRPGSRRLSFGPARSRLERRTLRSVRPKPFPRSSRCQRFISSSTRSSHTAGVSSACECGARPVSRLSCSRPKCLAIRRLSLPERNFAH